MTLDELFRMAYRGETDGHDRPWHAAFAKDRREMDALTRGANRAKEDNARAEAAFVPKRAIAAEGGQKLDAGPQQNELHQHRNGNWKYAHAGIQSEDLSKQQLARGS